MFWPQSVLLLLARDPVSSILPYVQAVLVALWTLLRDLDVTNVPALDLCVEGDINISITSMLSNIDISYIYRCCFFVASVVDHVNAELLEEPHVGLWSFPAETLNPFLGYNGSRTTEKEGGTCEPSVRDLTTFATLSDYCGKPLTAGELGNAEPSGK